MTGTTAEGLFGEGVAPGAAEAELVPLLTDYLDDVASSTATVLGDVAGVAVTLSVDGSPFTIGASSSLARDVDLIQYRIGKGPCLHALHHGIGLYVPDLGADDRWGEYGPQAAARGAASCVSIPVIVGGSPAAVFKVYSAEIDGLTQNQRALAQNAARDVAGGVALAKHLSRQAQHIDDRTAAMTTRRVIDIAIGIVMYQVNTDADTAFGLLRSTSQNQNIKLRDVAAELVASLPGEGGLPEAAPFAERAPSSQRDR